MSHRLSIRAWSLLALTAPLHLAWSAPAPAADLGGECCADLEERIAELEATTVRSGNRAVTLNISGQINQAILMWDDGEDRDSYVVTNSNSNDRLRFDGSARISSDLRAGYFMEFNFGLDSSARADQLQAGFGADEPRLRQSLWYFDSRKYGALTMGYGSPSTDDIIAYNLGGTGVAVSANAPLTGGNFFTRDATVDGPDGRNDLAAGNTISLRWRRFFDRLDTPRASMVRYDTPVLLGFSASASWGDDDYWDVAVRYARDAGEFKLMIGFGYFVDGTESADTLSWPRGGDNEPNSGDAETREFKGSASITHMPTGLFLTAAYLHREFSGTDLGVQTFACFGSNDAAAVRAQGIACDNRPDFDYVWLSGGLRRKFSSIGYTSLYGEYARSQDAVSGLNVSLSSAVGGDIDYVTQSTAEIWGLGLVQQIHAAQMDVYFSYRHLQADVKGIESNGAFVGAAVEDADMFMTGSRIRF
jgi:hypothetical protein